MGLMTGALASAPDILGISLGSSFVMQVEEHVVYVAGEIQERSRHLYVLYYQVF